MPPEHGGGGHDADSYNDEPFDLTMDEPEGGEDDEEEKKKKSKEHDYIHDAPAKMSAVSAPGVGNVCIPQSPKGKHKMSAQAANLEEPIQMARDRQEKARFAKMEQRLAAVENENKSLRERNELAEVQTMLAGLDVEGVDYDPNYELPKLVRMSKDERTAHLEYMRAKYQKALPGSGKIPVPNEHQTPQRFSKADQVASAGSMDGVSVGEVAAIGRLMAHEKISKEDAIAKIRGVATAGANGTVKVR